MISQFVKTNEFLKRNLSRLFHLPHQYALIPLTAFVIALFFAVYTQHVWEDYYITYRVSKNLATGHGLVYTVGEKLHVFTSPLNVLLPALLNFLTGNVSDSLVLWLFRFLCAGLLAISAVLLLKIGQTLRLNWVSMTVLICLFVFSPRIIDFSINGQETAFMIIFLVFMLHTLIASKDLNKFFIKLGLSWAGLMWTRPDGFIYITGIAAGFLLFPGAVFVTQSRKVLIKAYLQAALVAALLYGPWILWAWSYYGSPIPHTIIAKGLGSHPGSFGELLENFLFFPPEIMAEKTAADLIFGPLRIYMGGWPAVLGVYSRILSLFCAFFWIVPSRNVVARAVSLAFFTSLFYLSHIAAYPAAWYLPNAEILGILVLALLIDGVLNYAALQKMLFLKFIRTVMIVIAFLIVTINLLLFICTGYQLKIQQRLIENGNRMQVGLWLKENTAAGDTVFLEPLGYIGFFSQLKMLDYPGLCSREVVAARKSLNSERWDQLIPLLKPDWIIRRPVELSDRSSDGEYFEPAYSLVKVFNVLPQIYSYNWLPGRGYLVYDSIFWVLKRNPDVDK